MVKEASETESVSAREATDKPIHWAVLILICEIAAALAVFCFLPWAERRGFAYGFGGLANYRPIDELLYTLFAVVYAVQGAFVGCLFWLYWPRIWKGFPWLLVSPAGFAAYISGGCSRMMQEPSTIFFILPPVHFALAGVLVFMAIQLRGLLPNEND